MNLTLELACDFARDYGLEAPHEFTSAEERSIFFGNAAQGFAVEFGPQKGVSFRAWDEYNREYPRLVSDQPYATFHMLMRDLKARTKR